MSIIPTHAMRKQEIRNAKPEDIGWEQHNMWHWFKDHYGKRLDYWPSTGKWMFEGKVYRYGLQKFLKKGILP